MDPKERMKIPRQKMPEQKPDVRAKNFNEVPFGYTEELALKEANRCLQCKKPSCMKGCPVEINIPSFIKLIAEGHHWEAIRKIKETNSLPAVCGRVCPQESQCESYCIVGKKAEPVAIGRLERFAADYERRSGKVVKPGLAPPTGKRVAIVGSGPAGLTAAGDLIRMGHKVVIFEALHKAGGVLVYGIPEFRLPKEIVQAEVDFLADLGIEIHLNTVVGKADTLDDLLSDGFDAIFVGTGAGAPLFMNIPGENLSGVYSANEYLTRSNLMKAYLFPDYDTPIATSRIVAVVGGGNVAMDSARTALRLGAEQVHLIYRRSKEEMPARSEEVHHAEEEGVIFDLLTNPIRYIGDDKGRVVAVECQKMELGEPDQSGRRRPVPIKGSEYTMELDTVIVAIGNGPNPLVPSTTPDLEVNRKGNITADLQTCKTSKRGVFAGGDIVRGAATVILAMGDGKVAARSIDAYLKDPGWWDRPAPEPTPEKEEKKAG
ncbi:MAG: NADPH-dependent glutamate synthase [Candidatus Abyssobacteria bacterium SURF_17]|uniref:NADPH-dependent glutamate synthase n=1 Tax=Candidatus Abyssobacteria bacterium SURF_17 TaxID=2093361 RepID=A0A419ESN2_9BACT|nr:MAG: NADPH-dependent glutamate synthase [Candidatus Abyssubacteria bacterium SURF_17]